MPMPIPVQSLLVDYGLAARWCLSSHVDFQIVAQVHRYQAVTMRRTKQSTILTVRPTPTLEFVDYFNHTVQ
jgi:hypothetical protein